MRQHLGGLHLGALGRDDPADDVVLRLAAAQLEQVLEQPLQARRWRLQRAGVAQRPDAVERPADERAVAGEVAASASGMPSRSVMTAIGSGAAKAGTRSNVPCRGRRVQQAADGALDPAA